MTQSLLADNEETINQHLDKAERHLKRSSVDAFKYASMAYSRVYDEFRETYRNVDLSHVDNGEFLPRLTKLNASAEQLMHKAKMIESDCPKERTQDGQADWHSWNFGGNCGHCNWLFPLKGTR